MDLAVAQRAANNGCELLKWILKPLFDDDIEWISRNPTALPDYCLYCDFGQPDERGRTVISEFGFLNSTTKEERCPRKCRLVVYNASDEWLCGLKDHTICRPQSSSLPTKVIKIEKKQNPDGWHLTLVDNSKGDMKGSYAALTYIWGGQQDYMTTKDEFDSRRSGIDYDRLSKAIQDAIKVTHGLEIPYLWVDSQCIVQLPDNPSADDKEKQREAFLEQADIYSDAAITISASRSQNNNDGFIDELSFKMSVQRENTSEQDPVVLWKLNSRTEREPVHTRGWTFQEYKLSRRMVFFESYQLRMTCCCQNSPTHILERYDNDVEELRTSNTQINRFEEEDGGLGRSINFKDNLYQRSCNAGTWSSRGIHGGNLQVSTTNIQPLSVLVLLS
ncbi:heterokaryon incompatibility protein-domain-containing protein [Xylariaceae sp. FL0662B]|nr:heterokaryon incompatibility protein-domain-containing protein [Xylariaceae sp. FL0662B]